MKIVSYNLRFASEDDLHPWSRRRAPMIELLSGLAPQLIGTQEGLDHQLAELADGLDDRYRWVGRSRHGGSTEEYSAIFYDSERLTLVAIEHHWLSNTPAVPGSRSWGNELPRMVTEAVFTDLRTGTRLQMFNTHFDHASETARQRSATLIRELIRGRRQHPVGANPNPAAAGAARWITVLTGDFNVAAETSEPYRSLLETPLEDAFLTAVEQSPRLASFADYQIPEPDGDRIDWILITPGVKVRRAEIVDRAPGGQYPSDHLPVIVELELDGA